MKVKKPLVLTDANFAEEVLQSQRPVLVDSWAAWCGPCRWVGPTIDQLATGYEDSVKVAKLDIESNPLVASNIGIQSIPAVLLFRNGEVVDRLIGVQPREACDDAIGRLAA